MNKTPEGYYKYDLSINAKKWLCPKHGEITSTLTVSFGEHKGDYCQLCWVEKMVESGVPKVEEITTTDKDRV